MAQVLLLTAPESARDLSFLLEEEGHEPCFLPVLGSPRDVPAGLRAVAEQFHRFTWIVAVAKAPVRMFLEAVNQAGTRDRLKKTQWIAGDAGIARIVERQGGLVRVPGDGKWTSALSGLVTDEDDVLVLHEGELPEVLPDAIDATGARASWVELPPLRVQTPDAFDAQVVIVHSPAAGEAWAELTLGPPEHELSESCCGPNEAHVHGQNARLKVPADLRVVSTSDAVTDSLQSFGVTVHATAVSPSADAVVDGVTRALNPE